VRLKDCVAIVTGAGMGIGQAIAEAMAEEGAKIVVADILEVESKAVADKINKAGGQAIQMTVDVSSYGQIKEAVEAVLEKYDKIDVLVNNAGIGILEQFLEGEEESWNKIIAVNLKGPILFSKAVLGSMVERQCGKIINIASIAGIIAAESQVLYSTTKGGVIAFTKSLAAEMARHHINVNAICPGLVATQLTNKGRKEMPDYFQELLTNIPWGRMAQPEEIAKVAIFLASRDSEFITGQCIVVDGGTSIV
jgi:NAD(P)-dependent dehydrogenase (short-subunit alcohol dehydrogenase family)